MEMLTADEAARMLGVSRRELSRIVRSGKLVCRDDLYDPEEVAALKEIRSRRLDLADVAAMAQRAHMEAFRARRELEQIREIVGFNLPRISLDPESVRSLHTQAEGLCLQLFPFQAKEVVAWSRIFLALGEEYFEAVTTHTHIKEPWWTYLELAELLQRSASPERCRTDIEMKYAHDYLASARPQLRNAAFSRAHQVYGRRASLKMFPSMKGRGHQAVLKVIETIQNAKMGKRRR